LASTSYFFFLLFYKHFSYTKGYTLDDKGKLELYFCKEVGFLEIGYDVMEVGEIGREEMWVEGGYVMGSTERGGRRKEALPRGSKHIGGDVSENMGDTSMTYTEAPKYDFVTPMLLVRGGPRYGGRFDFRESIAGGLLLPEGEPAGGYVFRDEDCKVCFSGEELRVYMTKRPAVLASYRSSRFQECLNAREPRRR